MAFLRAEKKASGTYLRIIQSYKIDGKSKHKTLYSLGKLEDYDINQLERIAKKLLELIGKDIDVLDSGTLQELGRYNYGYAMVVNKLWNVFNLDTLARKIITRHRVRFDWQSLFGLMIAERINEPCSKLQSSFNQSEYLGFGNTKIPLHQFYRILDLLSEEEELIKQHLFTQHRSLFSTVLDVVFYDVTTLYFESQVEQEDTLRQKGYSKDGKAHKTQVVLGLLVDKNRNPISYQIYQGNTYEGSTMIDALNAMKQQFTIDRVVVVADTAMIDTENRNFMVKNQIDYIIGDSIKTLPKAVKATLINPDNHQAIEGQSKQSFSYSQIKHNDRRIICTYSAKRARKDAYAREKLIAKAKQWIKEPSKYKQVKKRGAGRFITSTQDGKLALHLQRIENDAEYDGFKAISTTTNLPIETILSKYSDLFEVEHTFRALKSQLEIRPVFHWTDKRIKGHIIMCFTAFTFINHLKNITKLKYRAIVKAIDRMQVSEINDNKAPSNIYLRSKIDANQQILIDKLKLKVLNDTTSQNSINQYFKK